ncbi:MAG: D-glycero-beta-D-manno-heptose 1-phosphate adenylyltransferase [Calditrichaeota bacterium]|nr:MAG: D-glycero-beta-D-manno-heptose 1-phosphate adenylyltransferase [Calditrichota bacterium]
MGRIVQLQELIAIRREARHHGLCVVFTNGCFDLLHRGHVELLVKAKELGDILIVGLNSDQSIKKIKGEKRPIQKDADRAYILAHLEPVDYVVIFNESTPEKLIQQLKPDVLVKGGDYQLHEIVGKDIVEKAGGRVEIVSLVSGYSTQSIIEEILSKFIDGD